MEKLSYNNAVERKNYECKTDTPQSLKLAMINVHAVNTLLPKIDVVYLIDQEMKKHTNKMQKVDIGNVLLPSLPTKQPSMVLLIVAQTSTVARQGKREKMKVFQRILTKKPNSQLKIKHLHLFQILTLR